MCFRNLLIFDFILKCVTTKFTFIDLFAGIGGTRTAFQNAGCKCIFSCEWDKYAQMTYEANFKEKPFGDIKAIKSKDIPKHDILTDGRSRKTLSSITE